ALFGYFPHLFLDGGSPSVSATRCPLFDRNGNGLFKIWFYSAFFLLRRKCNPQFRWMLIFAKDFLCRDIGDAGRWVYGKPFPNIVRIHNRSAFSRDQLGDTLRV